ncbi:WecB/TagA/CpsF family glycosyltransferase [Hyunsoonleella pacifica]|uniref:Glycosyltransferase n=1 Tax=Hyunsoonleella pacifica TaxID=1080224 RepID=A0A4Q9FRT7_9FLAO|nr:WecB/TagA/CpsF family glycosyltransferase [Hyunsoonleella pacifica]TBN18653.1 glycosyltransferase [Hyunsoonleella pacifica]GGD03570.1 beta-1,4-N-acetyl- mannosaminyltransferase [Hyunsoonleella pacifica]
MHKLSKVFCLGYEVFTDTLDKLPKGKKMVVNTINQYSYCIAEKDKQFKKSLRDSDILLPDGVGIVVAVKWLLGKKIKKIAGADIHEFLLHRLNKDHGSCFYMGASKTTLQKIESRIAKDYPNIKVGSYSPPFKKEFSKEENATIVNEVNTFKPDVLFVGMTAPKQEKWSLMHKYDLNVKGPICAIGAVFDFYAGTVSRPSKFWQKLGLEWFGRLIKEPKRMWKRYIYFGLIFGGYLIKAKVKPNYTS